MAFQVNLDKRKLEQIIRESPSNAHDLVFSLLHDGEAFVKDSMGSAGSPAPEGSPPGIVTGELKNSITVNPTGDLSGEIVSDKDYAAPLEFGSEKMGARPFMLPMAYWLESQVEPTFRRFIR